MANIRFIYTPKFNAFCIIIGILGVLCLLVAVVIFIINRFSRVSVSKVPVIRGPFGVKVNKTGTVLATCGASRTQACVGNAATVSAAIDYCNVFQGGCDSFIYDYTTNQVKIMAASSIITDSSSSDIYYRQIPI